MSGGRFHSSGLGTDKPWPPIIDTGVEIRAQMALIAVLTFAAVVEILCC